MSDAAEQLAQALRDLIDEAMPVAIGSNGRWLLRQLRTYDG
jgi:hypothetical protein